MIRIESDNMKKITIIFSLVASFFMPIFASELWQLSPGLKPGDASFQAARTIVQDAQGVIGYMEKTGSFLVVVEPGQPIGGISKAYDLRYVLNMVAEVDSFYGRKGVVDQYRKGGSQEGKYKDDISALVYLVKSARGMFGDDAVKVPYLEALAQERRAQYLLSPVGDSLSAQPFESKLYQFYGIPAGIAQPARPVSPMSVSEMVGMGLPPKYMAFPSEFVLSDGCRLQ